ncbi:MAG TPA: DUF374 domain-containing protein [Candidatus Limnocylindria bacterium]|nr:DUF374 domain-containing protein [Candidatus Limnocylindria bacterium]
MKLVRYAIAFLAGLLVLVWRLTCRSVVHQPDPRPRWRAAGRGYTIVLLHAHQLAAILANDERRMVAMVSRSADGDFLVPPLRLRRVWTVRGSTHTGRKDKGGAQALYGLMRKLEQGWVGLIAADGPRGPRNTIHLGAAKAAQATGTPILPAVVIPSRRWIVRQAWDRFQIPKPFCRIDVHFGEPIEVSPTDDVVAVTARLQAVMNDLERRWDPEEAPPVEAEVSGKARGAVSERPKIQSLSQRR